MFFPKRNPDALLKAFSLLISNGKLSRFAQTVASSGRRLAKNILASECITGYARLLERVLNFPSDAFLPGPISQLHQGAWEWNLFQKETDLRGHEMEDIAEGKSAARSVVYALEEEFAYSAKSKNMSEDGNVNLEQDIPNQQDWDILREIESSEEYESLEMEEVWYSLGLDLECPHFLDFCPFYLLLNCILETMFQTVNFFPFTCSLKKGWKKTLVYGMIYIVTLENLKNSSLRQMKEMRESLRGRASQYAFMKYTVELQPGHSCTMVLYTVG